MLCPGDISRVVHCQFAIFNFCVYASYRFIGGCDCLFKREVVLVHALFWEIRTIYKFRLLCCDVLACLLSTCSVGKVMIVLRVFF